MLKISIIEGHTERRLIVEGKLVGPWVAELRSACENVGLSFSKVKPPSVEDRLIARPTRACCPVAAK